MLKIQKISSISDVFSHLLYRSLENSILQSNLFKADRFVKQTLKTSEKKNIQFYLLHPRFMDERAQLSSPV